MISRSTARFRSIFPLAVFVVLAVAALLRFWALGRPATLVFDELYYVRDAITQLSFGFPTSWPDKDPAMGVPFASDPSFAVHPPLGKWLIGLGMLVLGTDNGWGWRSSVALFGVATVALTMRLSWRISRSHLVTILAGLFLAIDGVHVVLTRVALLDGFLAFFIVLGALFMWRDHEWVVARGGPRRAPHPSLPILVWRPWLIAAAIAFGCAASVKWSGLYPLAAFLVLTTVRDLVVRLRAARSLRKSGVLSKALPVHNPQPTHNTQPTHNAQPTHDAPPVHDAPPRPWLPAWGAAVAQALSAALIALPITVAVYIASWAGWIVSSGGWGRDSPPGASWPAALWKYHVDMFAWHSTLSAPHPYGAHPLTWPLGLRPTAMFQERLADGSMSAISPLPNLLIIWGGVAALLVLVWWAVRIMRAPRSARALRSGFNSGHRRHPTVGGLVTSYGVVFVLTGYLSGWLPWVLTVSRSAVFQFYAVVLTPFSAIALALVLTAFWRTSGTAEERFGRRLAVGLFVGAAVVVSAFFFPEWSGIPMADWFWRAHMWLPGWA